MRKLALLFTACLMMLATSCKVTIPPKDSIPPSFALQNYDAPKFFVQTADGSWPFDTQAWALVRNSDYDILFQALDGGGVQEAKLKIPAGVLKLQEPFSPGWAYDSTIDSTGETILIWKGDSNNPVDRAMLRLEFTALSKSPIKSEEFEITLSATDYHNNNTTRKLTIRVGGGPAGLVPL